MRLNAIRRDLIRLLVGSDPIDTGSLRICLLIESHKNAHLLIKSGANDPTVPDRSLAASGHCKPQFKPRRFATMFPDSISLLLL
jgi:hypothetical protein